MTPTADNKQAQQLAGHYRTLYDEELLRLAESQQELTEVAREILIAELEHRGLAPEAGASAEAEVPAAIPLPPPDVVAAAGILHVPQYLSLSYPQHAEAAEGTAAEMPKGKVDYTWKTQLCEVEEPEQAAALRLVLARAGVPCWIEGDYFGAGLRYPRVLVAADQLERARQIASQPIPQEIFDEVNETAPEFQSAVCPQCQTPDPVLEDVEPTNQWLCEQCGHRWAESATEH